MIKPLALTLLACGAIASTSFVHREPLFVWNASASVPIGLYTVRPIGALTVTDLVVARPPEPLAKWLSERRYLPIGAPLIKRVAGLPGQKSVARVSTSASMGSPWRRRVRAITSAARCPSAWMLRPPSRRDFSAQLG